MAPNYTEQDFEEHIEEHLLASGYHSQPPEDYDKDLCLIPDEVIAFIQATQPKEYEKLEKQYGADTPAKLVARLSAEVQKRGTLDVLRKGVKDRGVNSAWLISNPPAG